MAYILVALVFVMIAMLIIAGCLLGGQRLFPGRPVLEYFAADGIDLHSSQDPAIVLSEHPTHSELQRVRFATAVGGYNKDEVDQFVAQLLARQGSSAERNTGTSEILNEGK